MTLTPAKVVPQFLDLPRFCGWRIRKYIDGQQRYRYIPVKYQGVYPNRRITKDSAYRQALAQAVTAAAEMQLQYEKHIAGRETTASRSTFSAGMQGMYLRVIRGRRYIMVSTQIKGVLHAKSWRWPLNATTAATPTRAAIKATKSIWSTAVSWCQTAKGLPALPKDCVFRGVQHYEKMFIQLESKPRKEKAK